MLEAPLNPTLIVFLPQWICTILDKSILCAILFQSLLLSSLNTGTSPSYNSFDCVSDKIPDSACFLC